MFLLDASIYLLASTVASSGFIFSLKKMYFLFCIFSRAKSFGVGHFWLCFISPGALTHLWPASPFMSKKGSCNGQLEPLHSDSRPHSAAILDAVVAILSRRIWGDFKCFSAAVFEGRAPIVFYSLYGCISEKLGNPFLLSKVPFIFIDTLFFSLDLPLHSHRLSFFLSFLLLVPSTN